MSARSFSSESASNDRDAKRIAREMGVRYVVGGSFRRVGSTFRVNAQLLDGVSGHHIWAETYDVACDAFDEQQDNIVRGIAASVQTQIALYEGDGPPPWTRGSESSEEQLSRARNLIYQFTPEGLGQARRLAENAIEQSPDNDQAHQVLAMALQTSISLGYAVDWHGDVERAHEAAERAIELFEADEYNHCVCGFVLTLKRDHEGSVAEFTRAIEINDSCTVARGGLAAALAWAGKAEEAIANNEIACRSDRRNPSIFFGFFVNALAHFAAQRNEVAADWATQALRRKKLYKAPHVMRVAALAQAGEVKQARRFAVELRTHFPDIDRAYVDRLPFIRSNDLERFVHGLELAGALD